MDAIKFAKCFTTRSSKDRVYKSNVDHTWHPAGSEEPRLKHGKHPEFANNSGRKDAKGNKLKAANWGCDMTAVKHSTALGTTTDSRKPTAPIKDRKQYHEMNKAQNMAHHDAMKLLQNPDLKRRRFHKLQVRPGLYALDVVAYWNEYDKVWYAFLCEGFVTA